MNKDKKTKKPIGRPRKDIQFELPLEAKEVSEKIKDQEPFLSKENVIIDSLPPISPIKEIAVIEEQVPILQDSIIFKNGNNTLEIHLIKNHNRMYRIQIFFNGSTEIRNTTYTGSSAAMSFWNLLKESMKKGEK
jgi:hypothetical protein